MVPIARFDRAIFYAMHVHGGPAGTKSAANMSARRLRPAFQYRSSSTTRLAATEGRIHGTGQMIDVRIWLQGDLRPPEIEVRLYPNKRHFGQGWEGLKVTQAVSKLFSGRRNEILIREVGLRRNDDSPTFPLWSNYCAEGLDLGVLTQSGPKDDIYTG